MISRSLMVLALSGLATSAQSAPRVSVKMVWMIQSPTSFEASEKTVTDGSHVLKQRLLPIALATLSSDVAMIRGSKLVLNAGAQLLLAPTTEGRVFCALETMRMSKSGALLENTGSTTLCLLDKDKNGRFDAAFEVVSSPTGIVMQGVVPKQPIIVDATYDIRPREELKGEYWVGIRYEQYFNIYGNRMLMTDFGGRGMKQSLTTFDKFKSNGVFPRDLSVLGARFTILSAEEKGVRVKLKAPMPAQPFGVVSTTTYRFY